MGGVDVREDILLANLPRTDDGLPRAGSVIIRERLGKGGVGAVYLGYDEKLTAEVAVKVLHFEMAENRGVVERFFREARSTFKVDHPNVVRVLAVDVDAGTHYIVMEYVDGESADARVRREGPLPERDALEVVVWTGAALAAAHAEDILHRDVKPANIMIRYRDGRVKLTDLGLAKALGREAEAVTGLTASGQMLGTPAYMSPEQARDAASADARADVYSLGATLYTLLTNEPPFEATQLFDLLVKVMRHEPKDVRTLRPDVTEATAVLLKRLMDKAPPQRPQTMRDAVGLLRACLKQAPTEGARRLARPKMAGRRRGSAAKGEKPSTRTGTRGPARFAPEERMPTPALPPRKPRPTDPLGRAAVEDRKPTRALPLGKARAAGAFGRPPAEERAPTPALEPQETIPDQGMWERYASEKRTQPTVGLAPAGVPTSGRKKLALVLGIVVVLAAVGGAAAYVASTKKHRPSAAAPGDPDARQAASLMAAARAFRETGMLYKALDKLAEVLAIMPGHADAKRELWEIKAMIGAKETAGERDVAYRKWMDEGLRLKLSGKLREAGVAYAKAAESAPLDSREAAEAAAECLAEHHRAEGMKASARGDFEGAIELYAKALEKKDDPATREALAEAKANLDIRRAKRTGKTSAADWQRRGQQAEKRGELGAALKYYRQAAKQGADVGAEVASLEEELRRRGAPAHTGASGAPDAGEEPAEMAPSLTIDIGGGLRLEMKCVAPGRFLMGSKGGGYDERPAHEVVITKGFYLGKYEVTQEQYEYVMRTNPSHFKRSDKPVESVSWNDAVEFCINLTGRTARGALRQSGCEGWEFRLPTEAEWEYAARAGSADRYCFGDDEAALGSYGWYAGNSRKETHPVGRRRRNAWKLYDMHGNVWEWCADWYAPGYYAGSQREDPKGPASGRARALRGGSWDGGADYCRSARRNKYIPTGRYYSFGFRVALSPAD